MIESRTMRAEEINSGLKKKGELEKLENFSNEIEDVLEEENEDVERFNSWKPKKEDNDNSLRDKTVSEASTKTDIEKESNGLEKDFEEAKREFKSCIEDKSDKEKIKKGLKKTFAPFSSNLLKTLRLIEKSIYKNFMCRFNPLYFDSERYSVELRRNDEDFEMKIHVPDTRLRKKLKSKFVLR